MRRLQYTGRERLELAEVPAPEVGPGEVQIAVRLTGICGTDLHALKGHMDARVAPLPSVLGHEMVGEVAAVGSGVTGLEPGALVTVMPLLWCSECAACRAGYSHVCQRLKFVGIDVDGSMQELWTVPASIVIPLPAGMTLEQGVLVEPVAVAHHGVQRSGLVAGERAVVIGAGPIGMLIAHVARSQGAEVTLLELDGHRRRLAADEGFQTLDPSDDGTLTALETWTEGAGAQVVFEVSGSAGGVELGVQALAVRGRMVVVGIHTAERPTNLHRVFWRELTILGSRVYQRSDFEAAISLLERGVIEPSRLISAVFPLAHGEQAFAHLASGEAMKVLISSGDVEGRADS